MAVMGREHVNEWGEHMLLRERQREKKTNGPRETQRESQRVREGELFVKLGWYYAGLGKD